MQQALSADMDVDIPSARSSSPSRSTTFVVAGIAAATAGVLAINPVTPTPTPLAAEITHRAVELNAVVNPLVVLQETLTKTLTNLNLLGTGIPAASTSLLEGLGNSAIYAEFAELITANATNPQALLSVLQSFPIGRITDALASSTAILNTNLQNFPTILQNTLGYLQTGQFVEAFSEVNIYFLVQLLERPGGPLFPIFSIPGDTLAAIPGGGVLANLADAVFTRGIATGLTRALLVAPITATLFVAETLDHVQASFKAGDVEGALSELLSAPIGFVDAFLNGYVPDFPSRSPFAGLLSPNGFFDYFLVDVPNAIATALNATPQAPPVVTTAKVAASEPTDLGLSSATTTLVAVESTAPEAVSLSASPESTEPAAEPAATTPVVDDSASTGSTTAPTAAPTAEDEDEDQEEDQDEDTSTSGGSSTGGNTSGESNDGDDDDSAAGTTGGATTGAGGDSGTDSGGDSGGGDSGGSE
ncbi:hypothetical protein [Mycolicibacterium arenosum]|uniref:PE-PGRS family protein n=1 Tax=Mycolicibacterium arenosum TaxID=2952157 RepID=A0ABT1M616_9MYCO|nr:hypothetical protein [Mycolicibacterium sp. CAU 1645]MCP9274551.1 hypothetical protein [Mycolicibacterium sp. CAU 1645]